MCSLPPPMYIELSKPSDQVKFKPSFLIKVLYYLERGGGHTFYCLSQLALGVL